MALTTASNVADLSGGSVTASEPAMADLISQAGIMIARYCGYPAATSGGAPTMEGATYTHYSGTSQVVRRSGRDLVLEPYPVTAITSIYDDPDEEYTAAELVASSDYVQRGLHGEKIRLKSDSLHGGWSASDYAIRVIYTAGFTSVPDDLERAATELVLHMFNLRTRRGTSATSSPDGLNITYRTEQIPDHIKEMLAQYRLPSVYIP